MRGHKGYVVAVAFAALMLAGCSSIPDAGDIKVTAAGRSRLGSVVVAPVPAAAIKADAGEASRGWQIEEVFTHDVKLEESIKAGLAKAQTFDNDKIRIATVDFADTWNKHDDWVLATTITNVRITSDKHWYYYPNLLNCLLWVWTSWWVAGEDYTLSFDATVTISSGESAAVVVATPKDRPIKVSASGSFDEFDRGFHLLGCLYPFDDKDQWVTIAAALLPRAKNVLAGEVATWVDGALRDALEKNPAPHKKTLVLATGLSRYAANSFPAVNYADKDATDFAAALGRFGAAPHHVVTLTNGACTLASVRQEIASHLSRAREGDAVVFYFAGLGTRNTNGEPALMFHDGNLGPNGQPDKVLTLRELATLLGPLKGDKLVVLDTSYDGPGRSVKGGDPPKAAADFAALASAPRTSVLAATTSPGDAAVAPDYAKHGLFTYHLLRAIDKEAVLTPDGLASAVRNRVEGEAARLNESETPSAAGAKFEVKATTGR